MVHSRQATQHKPHRIRRPSKGITLDAMIAPNRFSCKPETARWLSIERGAGKQGGLFCIRATSARRPVADLPELGDRGLRCCQPAPGDISGAGTFQRGRGATATSPNHPGSPSAQPTLRKAALCDRGRCPVCRLFHADRRLLDSALLDAEGSQNWMLHIGQRDDQSEGLRIVGHLQVRG